MRRKLPISGNVFGVYDIVKVQEQNKAQSSLRFPKLKTFVSDEQENVERRQRQNYNSHSKADGVVSEVARNWVKLSTRSKLKFKSNTVIVCTGSHAVFKIMSGDFKIRRF